MENFDVVVVGGGPGGSSCAAALTAGGARVAVLDRARFPRVKLCAGWLSEPTWDVIGKRPEQYPHSLWKWDRCHVYFGGQRTTINATGYFIRREEYDNWLLTESGAEVFVHAAKSFERDGTDWVVDGQFRAGALVGAAGTHCPVSRALLPPKPRRPVGAQELEFRADPSAIAATRVGNDGEPELLLHDDLRGYAWNIPKTDWLNVGCGTMNPKQVRGAFARAREHFLDGHLPETAAAELEHAKGHSYYMFDPANLDGCHRDGVYAVGDSLGLAQPLTAEGILPALLSGKLCAEAILDGRPEQYRERMASNPVLQDYRLLFQLREAGASLRKRVPGRGARGRSAQSAQSTPSALRRVSQTLMSSGIASSARAGVSSGVASGVARGFAWMFAGKPLPGRQVLHRLGRKS